MKIFSTKRCHDLQPRCSRAGAAERPDPYEQRAQLGQTVLINYPNIKKVGRKGDHCEASSRLSWKAGRYFRFSRRVGEQNQKRKQEKGAEKDYKKQGIAHHAMGGKNEKRSAP